MGRFSQYIEHRMQTQIETEIISPNVQCYEYVEIQQK